MNWDSTAILERASIRGGRASHIGEASGCFFCKARNRSGFDAGDAVAKLNGYDCGERFVVNQDGVTATAWGNRGAGDARCFPASECELYARLPLIPVPWLPPLSLRDSFVVDELAVWFVETSISAQSFHWKADHCIEVARTLWEKRIPIEPAELSAVFCAHGLPSALQERFETLVKFATDTLLTQKPKKILKNKRLAGFSNLWTQPDVWHDAFVRPFLHQWPTD